MIKFNKVPALDNAMNIHIKLLMLLIQEIDYFIQTSFKQTDKTVAAKFGPILAFIQGIFFIM